jgi:hypothetical protein
MCLPSLTNHQILFQDEENQSKIIKFNMDRKLHLETFHQVMSEIEKDLGTSSDFVSLLVSCTLSTKFDMS